MRLSSQLVIATKDRPSEVEALLGGLAGLSRLPGAVLVVDASASAETERVCAAVGGKLRQDCSLHYVRARRAGLASQRNEALEHLDSDLVHFLDDDSRPSPDYFTAIEGFFEDDVHEAVGAVTGLVTNPGRARRSSLLHRAFLLESSPGHLNRAGRTSVLRAVDAPARVQCLSGCTMSFRTDLVRALRFDERLEAGVTGGYALGEDLEIGLRVARTHQVWCVPAATLRHEESPVNRAKRVTYEHAAASFRRRLAEDPALRVTRTAFWWSSLGEAALHGSNALLRRDPDGWKCARSVVRGARDRRVTADDRWTSTNVDDSDEKGADAR